MIQKIAVFTGRMSYRKKVCQQISSNAHILVSPVHTEWCSNPATFPVVIPGLSAIVSRLSLFTVRASPCPVLPACHLVRERSREVHSDRLWAVETIPLAHALLFFSVFCDDE